MDQSYQILIVDDEREIALLTKKVLEDKGGFTAEILIENEKTIEVVQRDRPGVIILDAMMSNPDGLDICQQIKTDPELRNRKVVIFSVKAFNVDRIVALGLGADAFLSKRNAVKNLIPTVTSLLYN